LQKYWFYLFQGEEGGYGEYIGWTTRI